MALRALRNETATVPTQEVIEARAAEYRAILNQRTPPEENPNLPTEYALNLKEVEAEVKRQVAAKRPRGLPRPKEVLKRARA